MTPPPSHTIDILANNALHHGQSTAWIYRKQGEAAANRSTEITEHILNWNDLFKLTYQMKVWLESLGIKSGDRVAWQAQNSLSWVLTEFACQWLGAVTCPLDVRLDHSLTGWVIDYLSPKIFLSGSEREVGCQSKTQIRSMLDFESLLASNSVETDHLLEDPWLDMSGASQKPSLNDLATILLTSGTSGNLPKGVMLSQSNLICNAAAKLSAMPQYPTDHRLNVLPFAHAYARTCELTTWLLSRSSMECVKDLKELFDRLPASRATLLNGVPLIFERIWQRWQELGGEEYHLRTLVGANMRQLASGGAPLPSAIRDMFQKAKLPIFQGYGLTETSPVVCSNVNSEVDSRINLSGVGPCVEGMEIRITPDSNLYVRGTGVMLGYWNSPEETQCRFFDLDNTGAADWFKTGDLAEISLEDGSVTILGRSDDTIVLSNGYKFHPLAMEAKIKQLPGVTDCIVIPALGGAWQVLLNVTPKIASQTRLDWKNRIETLCSDSIKNALTGVQLHTSPWTVESGLLNFKGGKRRQIFIQRFLHPPEPPQI